MLDSANTTFQVTECSTPFMLMFEGYGDLRTGTYNTTTPSNYKAKLEVNYFEAFVTFLHPESKYQGPGTDGFLFRDAIITTYLPKKQE